MPDNWQRILEIQATGEVVETVVEEVGSGTWWGHRLHAMQSLAGVQWSLWHLVLQHTHCLIPFIHR